MMHLSPYLFFSGNCRDAMAFYQSCLGGALHLQRFAESPMAAQLPTEAQEAILHGTLTVGGFILMASDAGGVGQPRRVGDNVNLSLHFDNEAEIDAVFARLALGGTVRDALADVPWGGKFGTLTDQFGINWLFNFQRPVGGV